MGCGASKPEVQSNGHSAGNAREAPLVRTPGPNETYNFSSAAQSPKHTVCLNPSDSGHVLWLCRWDSAFRQLCGGAGQRSHATAITRMTLGKDCTVSEESPRLTSNHPRRLRCLCPAKTWQFRSQWEASPRILLLHCTLQTREVTGNRCLRQRWCQTRGVRNKAPCPCLLACKHVCMHAFLRASPSQEPNNQSGHISCPIKSGMP